MTRIGSFVLKNPPDNGNPIRCIIEIDEGRGFVRAGFTAEISLFERNAVTKIIDRVGIRYRRDQ